MAKAMFYIRDDVQDVGYRVFIMEKILNSELKGTALNTPDGRIKVLLEGDRDRILAFIEELRKEWPELAKNPALSAPAFDEGLIVPDSMHSSQALLLGQFGKGVVYLKSIDGKIDALPERITTPLGAKIDALPERITTTLGAKIDALPERITSSLGTKIDALPERITASLGNKIDALPEKIAKAIKNE